MTTTCLDCGSDGASRVEVAAHCDPLPAVRVLGEWCPACAESVQRAQGAAMLHWLVHWFAEMDEARWRQAALRQELEKTGEVIAHWEGVMWRWKSMTGR